MSDKISVFGSSGFIGSAFQKMYSHEVIPIKSADFKPKSNIVLMLRSTTSNYTTPEENIEVNLTGLTKVLRNLKLNDYFCYISSWFCYSANLSLPINESAPTGALGNYSLTKAAAEKLVQTFCSVNNIKYNIVRLSNVIGVGDKYSKQKNALTWLIKEIQAGRDVNLYHGGNVIRDYLSVTEISKGIKFIIEKGKNQEIYNLGSGIPYKMIDLLEYIKKKTNSKSQFNYIEPPKFHNQIQTQSSYLDVSKLRDLGFRPNTDIVEVLDEILEEKSKESI